MKRYIPLTLLTLLALLISGCEVFPYVTQSTVVAPEVSSESTATAEPTEQPPTATLAPSATPTFTATPEEITEEPRDTTPTYTLQDGSPVALPNFNHPEAGCDWLGVAGQVFDQEGLEFLGLTVVVGDDQTPNAEPHQGQTGDAVAYGLGGYQIQFGEEPIDSNERFWIQVLDAEDAPLTARHYFDTTANCEENLILINFVPLADETQAKSIPTPTQTLEAYP